MSSSGTYQFWRWFFRGLNDQKPGYRAFLDRWLLLHLLVGFAIAAIVQRPLSEVATSVLLPLAGVFVGLSFAWAGNAQAILQSPEIEELMRRHPGGRVEYVYSFQASILFILIALVGWGMAGFGFPELSSYPIAEKTYMGALFFVASMAVRECWSVVLGAQLLILARLEIRQRSSSDQS